MEDQSMIGGSSERAAADRVLDVGDLWAQVAVIGKYESLPRARDQATRLLATLDAPSSEEVGSPRRVLEQMAHARTLVDITIFAAYGTAPDRQPQGQFSNPLQWADDARQVVGRAWRDVFDPSDANNPQIAAAMGHGIRAYVSNTGGGDPHRLPVLEILNRALYEHGLGVLRSMNPHGQTLHLAGMKAQAVAYLQEHPTTPHRAAFEEIRDAHLMITASLAAMLAVIQAECAPPRTPLGEGARTNRLSATKQPVMRFLVAVGDVLDWVTNSVNRREAIAIHATVAVVEHLARLLTAGKRPPPALTERQQRPTPGE